MIHARGLARTFRTRRGDVDAVRGVDLDVQRGEIVGFLGPNGAGKTTTLRMLTTLLEPTRGEATVAGLDLRRDPAGVRRRIGYVAQSGSTSGNARAGEEVVVLNTGAGVKYPETVRVDAPLLAKDDRIPGRT